MTARFVVRLAVTDGGESLYWLINAATGERMLSSAFRDTVAHLADAMNARAAARAVARAEAGSW